jgi:hypothetical protein
MPRLHRTVRPVRRCTRHYDALFAEKIDLLLRVRDEDHVTWSGRFRPPLQDAPITPRAPQVQLPASPCSPESAERAGRLGLPMVLGHIGGPPQPPPTSHRHLPPSRTTPGHPTSFARWPPRSSRPPGNAASPRPLPMPSSLFPGYGVAATVDGKTGRVRRRRRQTLGLIAVAGVRTVMLAGDPRSTAGAVARQLGILHAPNGRRYSWRHPPSSSPSTR